MDWGKKNLEAWACSLTRLTFETTQHSERLAPVLGPLYFSHKKEIGPFGPKTVQFHGAILKMYLGFLRGNPDYLPSSSVEHATFLPFRILPSYWPLTYRPSATCIWFGFRLICNFLRPQASITYMRFKQNTRYIRPCVLIMVSLLRA